MRGKVFTIFWFSWGNTLPYRHVHEARISQSEYDIFRKKMENVGLTEAYSYAKRKAQNRNTYFEI